MLRILFSFILLIGIGKSAQGQELPSSFDIDLPGVTSYRDDVPRPQDVFGHVIGTRHTVPHQLVDYFEAVAEVSDRVKLDTHAYSYENRPLVHAVVTSPQNHARLEELRLQNLRLSEFPEEVNVDSLAAQPIVIYQGYSIHGNEASGSEAAVLYLYHLAAGEGPAVDQILNNAIILLDPSLNPDGRDRFADWANRNRGGAHTSDPQDREHNEPWPGGRTNHYWFDLNRDWLPAQHPESQGRLELFHHWRPQILTDHHEMGGNATFFFMPGIPSRNNPLTPERNFELTAALGDYHAKWLDRIGSLYYSKESFDDYYYGKGSTYPDANGTIGILFEQASSRALETETTFGNLHYATTIQNQFATSLSTSEGAVALKDEFLTYHTEFYRTAEDVARSSTNKAFVVSLERDRTRAQKLGEMLRRHRIELYELTAPYEADGLVFTPGNAYVVPVDQPQARLVKSMFEPITEFQDSLFYDVSTWTMPLAFDVDAAEVRENPSSWLGAVNEEVTIDGGARVGGSSSYGYLMEWNRYFAPRALYRLQTAGLNPRLMTQEFTARAAGAERSFTRGTVFIPAVSRDRNAQLPANELDQLIDRVVEEDHVVVYAVDSGLSVEGPDMGTGTAPVLQKPEVALLTGSGASAYNAGEVWHLLSERYRIPLSLLDLDEIAGADLRRYSTIVMAGGSYSGLSRSTIDEWVRQGGLLITLASGTNWAVEEELVELEEKPFDMDSLIQEFPYDQLDEARGAQFVGGAIFEATLDTTHPLGYGFRDHIPLFRRGGTFFEPSETPGETVAVYSEAPLMSGYISEERLELMPGSAALIATRHGRGRVVLFMDNPNFRAFWYGSSRLFMNAVFLGNTF